MSKRRKHSPETIEKMKKAQRARHGRRRKGPKRKPAQAIDAHLYAIGLDLLREARKGKPTPTERIAFDLLARAVGQ